MVGREGVSRPSRSWVAGTKRARWISGATAPRAVVGSVSGFCAVHWSFERYHVLVPARFMTRKMPRGSGCVAPGLIFGGWYCTRSPGWMAVSRERRKYSSWNFAMYSSRRTRQTVLSASRIVASSSGFCASSSVGVGGHLPGRVGRNPRKTSAGLRPRRTWDVALWVCTAVRSTRSIDLVDFRWARVVAIMVLRDLTAVSAAPWARGRAVGENVSCTPNEAAKSLTEAASKCFPRSLWMRAGTETLMKILRRTWRTVSAV